MSTVEISVNDDFLSRRDMRLRHILPEWQGTSVSIYAVTETHVIPAKTQRFIEFLSSKLM